MSAWGTRRQISFVFIFVLLLVVVIVALIIANRHVSTCSDNIQNQGELNVDCGGVCTLVCPSETNDLVVLWTRIFKVREGAYDVAAFIENPNPFGLVQVPYHIRIYDKENVPVRDIDGTTYVNPHERMIIFEPQVNVGFREPTRAFLSFPDVFIWKRLKEAKNPTLTLTNKRIENEPILTLRATLTNDSLSPVEDIELDALLYDASSNVIAVSRTYVDRLDNGSSKEIFFTWPTPPAKGVVSAEIFPRVDLVKTNVIMTETIKGP
ncbi:MAG TPA: hypothetical protein VJK09_00385 [Candidatus Paceibacterota bacterium]